MALDLKILAGTLGAIMGTRGDLAVAQPGD
jgi:hypothetical protein